MLKRYCAIIPFYQDGEAGRNLLDRLNDMGCPQIWCDGRFREFQQIGNSDISTDGFRQAVSDNPLATLIETPGMESNEKLNALFDEAARQGFRYCFLFGCDELPEGDFDTLLDNLPEHDPENPRIFRLMMIERGKNGFWKDFNGPKERVFFRPDLLEAKASHWAYFNKNAPDGFPLLSTPKAESGLVFYHNNQLRPKWRDDMMSSYQKLRVPGERERTMQAIVDNAKKKHLDRFILKNMFPKCEIIEEENFEGKQQFKVMGDADKALLSDYQSYVIMPIKGGLFIRKMKIGVPFQSLNKSDRKTVVVG